MAKAMASIPDLDRPIMVILDTDCVTKAAQSSKRSSSEGVPLSMEESEIRQAVSESSDDTMKFTSIDTVSKKRKISCCSDRGRDDCSSVPYLETDVDSTEESEDDISIQHIDTSSNKRIKPSPTSDLIVVLDIDQCLIHCDHEEQLNLFRFSACNDDEENEANNLTSKEQSCIVTKDKKIYLRPGLVDFLNFVTSRFETHIFTAGLKDYADDILDELCLLIDNKRPFSKRWYREDCETIEIWDPCTNFDLDRVYVKPLWKVAKWAGRDPNDLRRIVHIDDRVENFLLNRENGIQVPMWMNDNPEDKALAEVTKVLQDIDQNDVGVDVRQELRKTYSYPELQGQLDMMHFFSFRTKTGIDV